MIAKLCAKERPPMSLQDSRKPIALFVNPNARLKAKG
jgi:hypothetical protein